MMLFEDETLYEGNFSDTGVFNGVGTLTYKQGDKLEGNFYGSYSNGMKFNGTIHKLPHTPGSPSKNQNFQDSIPNKIGRFAVPADQKWKSIYSFYYDLLSLPQMGSLQSIPNTVVIWDKLAICINQAKNNAKLQQNTVSTFSKFFCMFLNPNIFFKFEF